MNSVASFINMIDFRICRVYDPKVGNDIQLHSIIVRERTEPSDTVHFLKPPDNTLGLLMKRLAYTQEKTKSNKIITRQPLARSG